MTQVFVNYKRFEKSAIWREFHHGRPKEDTESQIFRTHKTNLPKNYSVPEGLKLFFSSVKSELIDPRNRNYAQFNLPQEELQALKELQQLQKERKVVIRACYKGAGIIVLNFEDYVKSCYEHLTSQQSHGEPYYSPASDLELEQAKRKIKNIVNEGFEIG